VTALAQCLLVDEVREDPRGLDTAVSHQRLYRPNNRKIFHAGTALKDDKVVTTGGRVLCVTALGHTVAKAQARTCVIVKQIRWNGVQNRSDIGYRAIVRERAK
jgi:phosphoribosylamine--glycine ligase